MHATNAAMGTHASLACAYIVISLVSVAAEAPSDEPDRLRADIRDPRPLSGLEEKALQPGDVFSECSECPLMVVVRPGKFIMGAPETEDGSDEDERPQHEVTIPSGFAVGQFSITFDQWDACAHAGGCRRYRPGDRGWSRGNHPVINLWWEDARAYVAWLSDRTGAPYRLLSEAEREYVTRAGTNSAFWWGNAISSDLANYDAEFSYGCDNSESSLLVTIQSRCAKGTFRRKTVPVDWFMPNPWGLFQVHGNAYEWVQDCWHKDYRGAPTDGSSWDSPNCDRHVMRGGAYNFAPWQLRSASRGAVASAVAYNVVGLRVARTLRR